MLIFNLLFLFFVERYSALFSIFSDSCHSLEVIRKGHLASPSCTEEGLFSWSEKEKSSMIACVSKPISYQRGINSRFS